MVGPKGWNAAKSRLKRPRTAEAKSSALQEVGKLKSQRGSVRQPQEQVPTPADANVHRRLFSERGRVPATIGRVGALQMKRRTARLGDRDKRLRALNKKLREIEALQQAATSGQTLDEQARPWYYDLTRSVV